MQKTLIALACASASLAASADPVILKVAHFWPATSTWPRAIRRCARSAGTSTTPGAC